MVHSQGFFIVGRVHLCFCAQVGFLLFCYLGRFYVSCFLVRCGSYSFDVSSRVGRFELACSVVFFLCWFELTIFAQGSFSLDRFLFLLGPFWIDMFHDSFTLMFVNFGGVRIAMPLGCAEFRRKSSLGTCLRGRIVVVCVCVCFTCGIT